ncbi:prepilin-type N-terminal cleavage/methylation domain-containing protein [Pilimelia columellifera]|uniref:Prepilin-type N-terminal cleavage/methylation domain-containing protein n=1 Tax=Pilimelia columellifera subsp. columellifera TaxID=706583 RepID=A0ABP6ASA7_9ACTN
MNGVDPVCDRGVSLTEVMVAMGIMSTVGTIMTAGIVASVRSASRAEALVTAQSAAALVYARADTDIRYSTDLGDPVTAGGTATMTYALQDLGAGPQCAQLRLTGDGRFERRTWMTSVPTAGGWQLLADGLTAQLAPSPAVDARTAGPFTRYGPATGTGKQRLRLRVVASAPSRERATGATDVTFTAWNSTSDGGAAAACQAQAR